MMASPPRPGHSAGLQSSAIELRGASRVTGGFLHGHAYGNVFNHADADEVMQDTAGLWVGRVQVYESHVNPTITKPKWSLKHVVTPKLKPVLKALSRQYSPVCSKSSMILFIFLFIFLRI
jgi:hypothetical protein